jgi:tryptophan-rich sensory protein
MREIEQVQNEGRTRGQEALGLIAFLTVCLAVSAIGGLATASSVGDWYLTLNKPAFNPPSWVFAPVWTILYILMAVAGWRVWRSAGPAVRRWPLVVFGTQLALNLLWSFLFFGLQQIGLALLAILLLLIAISVNTVLFWRIDRMAGWFFVPYVLWVAFASVLNLALWLLN